MGVFRFPSPKIRRPDFAPSGVFGLPSPKSVSLPRVSGFPSPKSVARILPPVGEWFFRVQNPLPGFCPPRILPPLLPPLPRGWFSQSKTHCPDFASRILPAVGGCISESKIRCPDPPRSTLSVHVWFTFWVSSVPRSHAIVIIKFVVAIAVIISVPLSSSSPASSQPQHHHHHHRPLSLNMHILIIINQRQPTLIKKRCCGVSLPHGCNNYKYVLVTIISYNRRWNIHSRECVTVLEVFNPGDAPPNPHNYN